jgi:hypothetical protein
MMKRQFTDAAMVADLRREAENLRTGKSEAEDLTVFTPEWMAGILDEYANAIEAGEFCFVNITDENGKTVVDHLWLTVGKPFAEMRVISGPLPDIAGRGDSTGWIMSAWGQ